MRTSKKQSGMKLRPGQRYAVLTGDIVGSSKLSAAKRRSVPDALSRASRAARSFFRKVVPLDADVFRGDSWQLVVADAKLGLRVALFVRAHLRGNSPGLGLDTRIGIGIGAISFLPQGGVSLGDGPAFRVSGQALEKMPNSRRLELSLATGEKPAGVAAVICLMDTLLVRWTEKQGLAVLGALQGLPQSEIAELWGKPVTQPVVARHLRQAGWEAIHAGLAYVENSLNEL
jgi:hypothetical protein